MTRKYSKDNTRQIFLHLLPVQIFSTLTSSLSGIVNGYIIGSNLTNIDMVALGFASPFTAILLVISTIISGGARIICGRFIGRGQKDKVQDTFSSSLFILIIIGIVLSISCYVFSEKIAIILGTSSDAVEKTSLYIKGISIGLIPSIISPCLMGFLQMENYSKYALASTVVLAVSNLSLGLIYSNTFTIDIYKVAIITSISQYITLVFLLVKFIVVKNLPRLSIKHDLSICKEIIVLGFPAALAAGLYAIRNSVLNNIAYGIGGDNAVNALSILNSSCGPLDAFNIGVGSTQLMLASVYVGEKDSNAIKELCRIAILYGLVIAGVKVGLISLFVDKLAILYGASGEALDLTVSLYKAYSLCMPLNIITVVVMNTYQTLGRVRYCNILYLVTCIVAPLSISYFGGKLLGINAVWNCYWISEVIVLAIIYLDSCIYNKKLTNGIGALLYVERDIEIEKCAVISIKNIDEVTNISRGIELFCLENNIDKRRSMLTGLCCEEITANIVEHGFSKSKKLKKTIDIYVGISLDEVHIRIKDNAVAFDPHIKLQGNDDITSNIGIRMVSKIAKEMNYQNTFNLNILSINL